jgi:hypothetical protein
MAWLAAWLVAQARRSRLGAPVGVQVVQRAHELLGDRLHHVLGQALVVLQDLKQLALSKLCSGAGGGARPP